MYVKKFLAVFLLAVSLMFIQAQDNKAEAYWGVVVNCNEWITLRSAPSTEAYGLTTIPLGEWVWINSGYYNNGFYSAEYNGMKGYVLAAYIKYVKD